MRNIIQFSISRSDGYYIAKATGLPIVTQARTFEELQENIREAVEVYLHGEDAKELGFSANPSVLANFEIPRYATQTSRAIQ